ncbi:MAG: glutaminase, partial [Pseudomonadota bacterium]
MTDPDLPQILDRITAQIAAAPDRGRAARYIPELADIDTSQFGIAVAPVDGPLHAAGDADTAFSVQSVSKVFTLTLALET